MSTLKLPVYLNCHFFQSAGVEVYTYKIDKSAKKAHPFQLFKWKGYASHIWENLSVYASINDAIMVMLKELFTKELMDEIAHGQATINPAEILEKINHGERSVSLYGSAQNERFRIDLDVDFENLIERK